MKAIILLSKIREFLMLDEALFGRPLRFIKYMLPVDEYDGRRTYYARKHIISLYEENEVYEYYDEDNGEIFRKYQDYSEDREDSEDSED